MPSFKGRRPTGTSKSNVKRGPMSSAKSRIGKKFATTKNGPIKKALPKKKFPAQNAVTIERTGMESLYFKELVDNETPVVVVLNDGETIHGCIRYYDHEVFSIGPTEGGPKINIRKTGVRYIYEEE